MQTEFMWHAANVKHITCSVPVWYQRSCVVSETTWQAVVFLSTDHFYLWSLHLGNKNFQRKRNVSGNVYFLIYRSHVYSLAFIHAVCRPTWLLIPQRSKCFLSLTKSYNRNSSFPLTEMCVNCSIEWVSVSSVRGFEAATTQHCLFSQCRSTGPLQSVFNSR